MSQPHPIVFLVDVDNTLIDNDGLQQDLKDHLESVFGRASRERYWRILEDLFSELGYRDYIGALQGQYAQEAKVMSALPPPDVTIERIGDLLDYDLARLRTASVIS